MTDLRVKACEIRAETPLIKSFRLVPSSGSLPGFQPGAHIRIALPGGGDRAYSLINFDPQAEISENIAEYCIAVRLEEESTGGSAFMHGISEGTELSISTPRNDFALVSGNARVAMYGGGIGITPITAMVTELRRSDREFELHYCGRSRGTLAFIDELRELAGERLTEHYDDEPETALDLSASVGAMSLETQIYVCGPKGMIEAVKNAAKARGFAESNVHFELFTNQAAATSGDAFEIELASTGEVLPVPAGKSIIEVLEEAGHDVLYDCQRGDCGICQTEVISGVPDHRDVVLSDEEKKSGKVMQICVSRSKTPRLVLDL